LKSGAFDPVGIAIIVFVYSVDLFLLRTNFQDSSHPCQTRIAQFDAEAQRAGQAVCAPL
jgi:hypothetical protein